MSANITPDNDTGIGKWSERDFLNKFYQYRRYVEKGSPEIGPEGFTLMPWLPFCQLPEEDLKAIYAFLKTQPAVYNPVETHPTHLQPVKPVSLTGEERALRSWTTLFAVTSFPTRGPLR